MRVAPPVQALSCGAGPWRWTQQALYALSAAALAFWTCSRGFDLGPIAALVGLGVGAAAAVISGVCLSAPPVQLQWDGAVWTLRGPALASETGQVTLMLDLGAWMLVRFVPVPRATPWAASWLPLRRRDMGAHWRMLRVALYAAPAGAAVTAAARRSRAAASAPAGN